MLLLKRPKADDPDPTIQQRAALGTRIHVKDSMERVPPNPSWRTCHPQGWTTRNDLVLCRSIQNREKLDGGQLLYHDHTVTRGLRSHEQAIKDSKAQGCYFSEDLGSQKQRWSTNHHSPIERPGSCRMLMERKNTHRTFERSHLGEGHWTQC